MPYDPREHGAQCRNCRKPFTPPSGNVRKGFGFYCSRACRFEWERAHSTSKQYVGGGSNSPGRVHVVVAERALGYTMPKGWEVHHVNEVKTDNEPENLIVCKEKRGHALLHCVPSLIKYAAWLGALGASVRVFTVPEPEGMRWCTRCGQLKPVGAFFRCGGARGGLRGHCKECH